MSTETTVVGLMTARTTKPNIIRRLHPGLRQFSAISIGPGVPRRHFDGWVHSTFERVCNLELTCGGLVALAGQDITDAPRTIRIELPDSVSFSAIGWPGRLIACRGGVLRFGGAGPVFDLRPANDWSAYPPIARRAEDLEAIDQAWPRLRAISDTARKSHSPADWRGLEDCIDPNRLAQRTVSQCVSRLDDLIGRGPGLTPAGDDFVTGFLAGLYLYQDQSPVAFELLRAVDDCIGAWSRRSTDVSRWMLLDAALGRFAEPVMALCLALVDGEPGSGRLEIAAARVLAFGHLSGIATIQGLVSGIATAKRPGDSLPRRVDRVLS